jgi:hypothetical protein
MTPRLKKALLAFAVILDLVPIFTVLLAPYPPAVYLEWVFDSGVVDLSIDKKEWKEIKSVIPLRFYDLIRSVSMLPDGTAHVNVISSWSSGLSSHGTTYHLRRKDGKWRVYGKDSWMS